jgi:hypothetical protein
VVTVACQELSQAVVIAVRLELVVFLVIAERVVVVYPATAEKVE